MKNFYTEQTDFFAGTSPQALIEEYGSPLYVYNETILRTRCREMATLIPHQGYKANYSIKANSNLTLLKIIHQEGLHADAVSPGEIFLLMAAGFTPDQILYISGNMSKDEMSFAISHKITISADSISQLKMFGNMNPGGSVAVRFNPGIGTGHHKKVVTGGKNTKFGIDMDLIPNVNAIAREHCLHICGINHHIGSLFMDPDYYIESAKSLLSIASRFDDLKFIDFGGGFGIPYRKQEGQHHLDIRALGDNLASLLYEWTARSGNSPVFLTEPGRYVVAECGVLLGTVHAIKNSYDTTYIGTDLGFNTLARPVMYDSHHDIEVYRDGHPVKTDGITVATVVGNICESGDILAKDRNLPIIHEGDILGIMDAGAYGYSMSSNYNCRLRPAEVLIGQDNRNTLIRRRETIEDLMANF